MKPKSVARGVGSEERRAARRAFWLFMTVAVVCTAQVGWWIIFQIGETNRIAQLQWGILGTARDAITLRLKTQYAQLWTRLDSVATQHEWDGTIPPAIMSDPAIKDARNARPGAFADSQWVWQFAGKTDTLWVQLDPEHPEEFLSKYGRSFQWAGAPPKPGLDPWPGPAAPLAIKQTEADDIENTRRHEILMFASEGSFFVVLIILGAYLIYRTVRQSAELRRRQQNFIAAVTHELKAPLASVKLYAETLERPQLDRVKQLQYLGHMLEDVARLEELIDNILLAGRFERKGFELKVQRANLSADVAEYIESMRGFLDRNQFQLRTTVEPNLYAVTDYDALRRVVDSIVENAVKYSGARKEGDLSLSRNGHHVILKVRDYGAGVPPEENERVFDAFYRVGDEMTRQIKGTGLGLYLVREIVAAHGGTVKLESAGIGQGSTVTVTLKGVT
jgi:signal transduction histidine kinase